MNKPSWVDYFLIQSIIVSSRSIDPNTKCGCVITNQHNEIKATGYNGPVSGLYDELVPLTRPRKYLYMDHSEHNALRICGYQCDGWIAYVSGKPCLKCMQELYSARISKVYYTDYSQPKMIKSQTKEYKHFEKMMKRDFPLIFIPLTDIDITTLEQSINKIQEITCTHTMKPY